MTTKTLSIIELADLFSRESRRGIINGEEFLIHLINNKIPRTVNDIRGDVRMAIERAADGENFEVTKHMTPLAEEKLSEVCTTQMAMAA